jgi:predicted nucleic acid-binding protein
MSNVCRKRGVAATSVDLLICAVALRNKWSVFTTDRDFERYSRMLGVKLFSA